MEGVGDFYTGFTLFDSAEEKPLQSHVLVLRMKTILLLANTLLLATSAFAEDAPTPTPVPETVVPAAPPKPAPFVPRLTTLRGASLQPATGLQTAIVQASAGIRQSGEGTIFSGLSSDDEWRRLFPKKYVER